MTVSVRKVSESFQDMSYEITVNGEVTTEVHVRPSMGKVEVHFPILARNEAHTVVLTTGGSWVESREPDRVETPPLSSSPPTTVA